MSSQEALNNLAARGSKSSLATVLQRFVVRDEFAAACAPLRSRPGRLTYGPHVFTSAVVYSKCSPLPPEATLLRTLDRYILREVAATWVAVSGVLLVILVSNQLARVLSQAAANDFPREVVLALIALSSAGFLTVVVPIGFFLAIMLALGRLYHESEMAAIQSCGVGPAGLYRPIGVLGLFVSALLVWLSFWAIPGAVARAKEIRTEAVQAAQFGSLEPGRFRTFAGGAVVFYAERVDDNGILHNVHVFVDRPPRPKAAPAGDAGKAGPARPANAAPARAAPPRDGENTLEIWVATRAEQRGAGQPNQMFVLYDGERYEGVPGSGEFRIIKFAEGGIPIQLGDVSARATEAQMKPTRELLSSSDPRDQAELQWRSSTPILALVLMLIAVPLARLRPRQGRFGRIGVAILTFFLYYQVLIAARTWVENGVVPASVGVWWVHLIALALGVWLLYRQSPLARVRTVEAVA